MPRVLTRTVLLRATGEDGDVLAACNRLVAALSAELSEWIGEDGVVTLLRRAFETERANHACLGGVRVVADPNTGGVSVDVAAEGLPDASGLPAGLEAGLACFVELLGRFIGIEMATRLAMRAWRQHMPVAPAPEGGSP